MVRSTSGKARDELTDRATKQQERFASGLHAMGNDLGVMARSSEENGLASELVRERSQPASQLASWLEHSRPTLMTRRTAQITSARRRRRAVPQAAIVPRRCPRASTNRCEGRGDDGRRRVCGAMAVLFLSLALWAALAGPLGGGGAGVIVGVLWALVALILFVVGRSQLKNIKGMPQTTETLKEFPPTLKRNEENK